MEQNTILDKIKVPTFVCVELNLFGGSRAFQLLRAFFDHRQAKGREAQKGKTKGKKTTTTTTNKY